MAFSVQVLADSRNQAGDRVITFEYTAPRIILAEINTHAMLVRNAESSRAIPVKDRILQVIRDPFVPITFGKNMRGMQALDQVADQGAARDLWIKARNNAVAIAQELADLDVHKQVANRIIEPFTWVHGIISGTDHPASLQNFFALRSSVLSDKAEPHFMVLADLMLAAMRASTPQVLDDGAWHLPLVRPFDLLEVASGKLSQEDLLKLSVARIARVSYNAHTGLREPAKDLDLYDRLLAAGDMSPFGHPCAAEPGRTLGNFPGFHQFRHTLPRDVLPFSI